MPPEADFHYRLAETLDTPGTAPPPALQTALTAIERWRNVLHRKKVELDGDAWDAIHELWETVDSWEQLSPEAKAQIIDFLDNHRPFIEELRRVAAAGGPMEAVPKPPAEMDEKHLGAAQDLVGLLWLDAVCRARDGDLETAVDDCIAGFQFADALGDEPDLMVQWTRIGCTYTAVSAVVDVFSPGTLSKSDTARLIYQAQHYDGRAALAVGLEHWRAYVVANANETARKDWVGRYEAMSFGAVSLTYKAGVLAYTSPLARPWVNRDVVRTSEWIGQVVAVAPYPYYEALERYVEPTQGFAPFARQWAQYAFSALESEAGCEARLQLLQIGLTLEQYQVAHGTLPDSLDALSSELPEAELVDPFTGDHLVYRVDGDTFVLYSAGLNLQDDGGRHDWRTGDIVWRGNALQ